MNVSTYKKKVKSVFSIKMWEISFFNILKQKYTMNIKLRCVFYKHQNIFSGVGRASLFKKIS